MPDAKWHEIFWMIRSIGRRQVIREAWRLFGEAFEPGLRVLIEEQFAAADSECSEDV